ncbi:chromosome partitioning protein ParB, partial [Mesorhizobium sp. M1A.F.Ca.IN.020.03.2.1]
TIPLNKLDVDPKNVRKTYSAEGIKELPATIRADGYRLLQNLIVRKGDKKGRYFVTAGGRRRAALLLLAEAGEIAKDFPVECKQREVEDATAISLTENLHEAMHPADQFEAFNALAGEGKAVADIATRFGTTETIVRKRLALARVSPVLLQLFRDEEMSFAQLSAFTVSDDQERQVEVWNALPSWNRDVYSIRRALTEELVAATDKRVQFIGGLADYEAVGGPVKRDLFDESNAGYVTDAALLEKLVAEKLEAAAEAVRAEGWKWVEITTDLPYDTFQSYGRRYPKLVDLGEEEQVEFDKLTAEYDQLAELLNADVADEDAEPRLDEIEERLEQLRDRSEAYEPEAFEAGGAIITLANGGAIRIERGLVRPEDQPKRETAEAQDSEAESGKPKVTHSAALIEDLTAQKTAALRIELANNPDIALAAVVHAMLSRVVGSGYGVQSALQISVTCEHIEGSMKQPDANKALAELENMRENWGHKIPGNPADLWEWCLDQTRDELLGLLAFAAAHSVNA